MAYFNQEPPFKHGDTLKVGILLANLGTPDAANAAALRRTALGPGWHVGGGTLHAALFPDGQDGGRPYRAGPCPSRRKLCQGELVAQADPAAGEIERLHAAPRADRGAQ